MKRTTFLFFLSFSLFLFSIVIYSYAFVDLNLTLTTNSLYLSIQKVLTQLGYYNRPLSSLLFIFLLLWSTLHWFWLLKKAHHKENGLGYIKGLILICGLLIFSYPAFSYDFFNYLFDARIVTQYGLSPYHFKALDFPLDPWIRFMHWTHRYYPYGPGWLLLTLIPSFLGAGKFLLTVWLYKIVFYAFHLLNIWLIYKVMQKIAPQRVQLAVAFYAFNPLVLYESLISPHNEVMMLSFALLAVYLMIEKKDFFSLASLFLSVAIKFISITLLPLFVMSKKIDTSFFKRMFFLWLIPVLFLVVLREPYSWYFLPLVACAALWGNKFCMALVSGLSLGLLMRYLPYIFLGEYGSTTTYWQMYLMLFGTIAFSSAYLLWQKHE